uniref:Small integral membrane protein 24 n=1 Tax=Maylandia zebra TaxID=106582 RepID=A0A3P9B8B6_9CICH|nr:small integral membrane protein 24 isoform X1 [Maylandia zebra]
MGTLYALTSCLLLAVGTVTAQTEPTNTNERALPQWLTGIIAVCGFLFLAFVVVLAKKAWCENPSSRTSIEDVRERDIISSNLYDMRLSSIRRKSTESGNENTYETNLDAFRSKDAPNAFNNLAADINGKTTSM